MTEQPISKPAAKKAAKPAAAKPAAKPAQVNLTVLRETVLGLIEQSWIIKLEPQSLRYSLIQSPNNFAGVDADGKAFPVLENGKPKIEYPVYVGMPIKSEQKALFFDPVNKPTSAFHNLVDAELMLRWLVGLVFRGEKSLPPSQIIRLKIIKAFIDAGLRLPKKLQSDGPLGDYSPESLTILLKAAEAAWQLGLVESQDPDFQSIWKPGGGKPGRKAAEKTPLKVEL